MIHITKTKGNRYVLPFLVTFGYLLVTMKNAISKYSIVYSKYIGNRVTIDIWSRVRKHTNFSEYMRCLFSGYLGYLPYFQLYIITYRLENMVTKKVTKNEKVTGCLVTVTGGWHV